VVGDHPGGDPPDHEPATFPRQGGWIGGLNEDAAEPLGKKIVWEFTKKNWGLLLKRYPSSGHILNRFIKIKINNNTKKIRIDF
jgi:hypothetical protein